jgi:hypothetical protein
MVSDAIGGMFRQCFVRPDPPPSRLPRPPTHLLSRRIPAAPVRSPMHPHPVGSLAAPAGSLTYVRPVGALAAPAGSLMLPWPVGPSRLACAP